MGFISKIWSIIKELFLNFIIRPFIYICSNNNYVVSDNKKCGGSESERPRTSTNDDEDEANLPEGLRRETMPRHVAVILDGNRRWAKQRGLSYIEGYEAGVGAMGEFIDMCAKFKIPVVSLFTFSSENWNRPKEEVAFLMKLFESSFKGEMGKTLCRGGRVSVIGDKSNFPTSLQKVIKDMEESTKDNTKLHIIFAMSYSGQYDIVQACKSIANKVKDGLLDPKDVTKSLIETELETKLSNIPNPDLLIRTSGELRISNYYLWQSAYTEMYFTDIHWPDFEENELVEALRSFQQRGRRFGAK